MALHHLEWVLFAAVATAVKIYFMPNVNTEFPGINIQTFALTSFFIIWFVSCCWWFKLRFTQTHLILEQDRVILQKVFFERYVDHELPVKDKTNVVLGQSFRLNNKKVGVIVVRTGKQTLKFGTLLSEQEQYWLIDRINEFLQAHKTTSRDNRIS